MSKDTSKNTPKNAAAACTDTAENATNEMTKIFDETAQIGGLDRLVGDHGETGAGLDLMDQRGKIACDVGVEAGFPNQRSRNSGVPPRRCEDDGTLG